MFILEKGSKEPISQQQIDDLAASCEILKEIRARLLSAGVDLDYFEKRFGIAPMNYVRYKDEEEKGK